MFFFKIARTKICWADLNIFLAQTLKYQIINIGIIPELFIPSIPIILQCIAKIRIVSSW